MRVPETTGSYKSCVLFCCEEGCYIYSIFYLPQLLAITCKKEKRKKKTKNLGLFDQIVLQLWLRRQTPMPDHFYNFL